MKDHVLVSLRLTAVLTVLLGLAYPFAVRGVGWLAFRHAADGSLVPHGGRIVGSELIGQPFAKEGFFQPRPSAAGGKGYDPTASGGTNLGPTSRKLADALAAEISRRRGLDPGSSGPLPADSVTSSGSGLDPHISPGFARLQVPRVAKATGIPAAELQGLVARRTEGRFLGVFGDPRVNVLALNLEVAGRTGKGPSS